MFCASMLPGTNRPSVAIAVWTTRHAFALAIEFSLSLCTAMCMKRSPGGRAWEACLLKYTVVWAWIRFSDVSDEAVGPGHSWNNSFDEFVIRIFSVCP